MKPFALVDSVWLFAMGLPYSLDQAQRQRLFVPSSLGDN
jgi:hypothetical protein